jgi:coatomer subunit epsilon
MDRPDLASKTVRQMQAADEDNTLTQLALAWTHLAVGGAKLQEAQYLYDELSDKFEATVRVVSFLFCVCIK